MTGPYCALCGDPIYRMKSPHGVPYGRWHHLIRSLDRKPHKAQPRGDKR